MNELPLNTSMAAAPLTAAIHFPRPKPRERRTDGLNAPGSDALFSGTCVPGLWVDRPTEAIGRVPECGINIAGSRPSTGCDNGIRNQIPPEPFHVFLPYPLRENTA